MQDWYSRGAAYEERQRKQSPYPAPHQEVLRALKMSGPMRIGRLAAALGAGARRMELTCAELVEAGAIKRDAEAFYEIVEPS